MINDHGIAAEGVYSEETLNEMTRKKENLVKVLTLWAAGNDEVYDLGSERKRNTLRDLTKLGRDEATEIYKWHWRMAWSEMEWKEGKPHDLVSANYKWNDKTRLARANYWNARRGYKNVAREMKKFNFHLWRRI
jgi:hypothetical protein